MKYSFMSFSCPELSLDKMIGVAKKYGYDGIEPRISANHKHGVELDSSESFRRECKQKSQESGIPICCIATSCRYADPEINKEQINDTHKAINLAGDIGAIRIRVFGGAIPKGITQETAIELVAESMQTIADHAAERGVIVCMETHDSWCNPRHLAEAIKRVNHPAIAVNWDIMHPVRVGKVTMEEAFQVLKPWIKHVHFHDGAPDNKLVHVPIGGGYVDHRRAVKLLKTSEYDGFLSGEWINWESYEAHLPRELSTMKKYEQEAESII